MPTKKFTPKLARKPSNTKRLSASTPVKRTKGGVMKKAGTMKASPARKRTKSPTRTTGTGTPRSKARY